MKLIKSIQFLTTLILILPNFISAAALPNFHCMDIDNPLEPMKRTPTPCRYVKAKRNVNIKYFGNKHDKKYNKHRDINDGKNMFKLSDFRCTSNSSDVCNKVEKTFETAGRILSDAFIFKDYILVNISFISFCNELNDCPTNTIHLGSASPKRNILMGDSDNVNRYYPQALVKQFDLEHHPEFSSSDIVASFNTEVKWYFGGKDPIKDDEMEFLTICLHELVHGLGFRSDWGDWIGNQAVISYPTFSTDPSDDNILIFNGFMELCFDKYLVLLKTDYPELDNKPTIDITKELNTFANGPGSKFSSTSEFINKFLESSQFKLAQKMYNVTTKANTLAFSPVGCDPVILDTSFNPFSAGSSIVHVDQDTYEKTGDFLMKSSFNYGITLEQIIKNYGDSSYGPIGSRLRKILGTMGYQTTTSGSNLYRPTEAKPKGFPLSTFDDFS